jgi:hypothetical protein
LTKAGSARTVSDFKSRMRFYRTYSSILNQSRVSRKFHSDIPGFFVPLVVVLVLAIRAISSRLRTAIPGVVWSDRAGPQMVLLPADRTIR